MLAKKGRSLLIDLRVELRPLTASIQAGRFFGPVVFSKDIRVLRAVVTARRRPIEKGGLDAK